MAAGAAAGLSAAGSVWLAWPSAEPRAVRTFQLTDNGPVHAFVTDGARVYYSAGTVGPQTRMYQVSAAGGEPVPLPQFNGMIPLDISPDRSDLLLGEIGEGRDSVRPLWVASVVGTGLRRLGGLRARYARWSSTGDQVLYTISNELRIANADGSSSRAIFKRKDADANAPHFLTGGRRIRFTLVERNVTRMFEVNVDGSGLHPVLAAWTGGLQGQSATTADGRYCAFNAGNNNHDWDLWVMRSPASRFGFSKLKPVRLTSGPIVVKHPQFSPDGRRIFFTGDSGRTELVEHNGKSGHWGPYMGGMDAFQLDFSRDGQWITYVGPPGLSVWRRRVNGTDAVQLTTPPLNAVNPRWSPDGSSIIFYGGVFGQPTGMFLVSPNGGPAIPLSGKGADARFESEPSWSPDGKRVLYSVDKSMEMIEVESRNVQRMPNSDGLFAPRWSPDGKYAVSPDRQSHLALYDITTHERTVLSTLGAGFPSWSPDSRYVYFENGPCSILYKVDIRTREVSELASLEGLKMARDALGWVAVAPDGSVISARDLTSRNIYGLDLELPQ